MKVERTVDEIEFSLLRAERVEQVTGTRNHRFDGIRQERNTSCRSSNIPSSSLDDGGMKISDGELLKIKDIQSCDGVEP